MGKKVPVGVAAFVELTVVVVALAVVRHVGGRSIVVVVVVVVVVVAVVNTTRFPVAVMIDWLFLSSFEIKQFEVFHRSIPWRSVLRNRER